MQDRRTDSDSKFSHIVCTNRQEFSPDRCVSFVCIPFSTDEINPQIVIVVFHDAGFQGFGGHNEPQSVRVVELVCARHEEAFSMEESQHYMRSWLTATRGIFFCSPTPAGHATTRTSIFTLFPVWCTLHGSIPPAGSGVWNEEMCSSVKGCNVLAFLNLTEEQTRKNETLILPQQEGRVLVLNSAWAKIIQMSGVWTTISSQSNHLEQHLPADSGQSWPFKSRCHETS